MESVFSLFKRGLGPSSSHTTGPMLAAGRFLALVGQEPVARITITLFGSLALTGRGHATDRAVILGLAGASPAMIDPLEAERIETTVRAERRLSLGGSRGQIAFDPEQDILWHPQETRPHHPNALRFTAFDQAGAQLSEETYYSTGGGFVMDEGQIRANAPARLDTALPYPFDSADDLLKKAHDAGLTIAELAFKNECAMRPAAMVETSLDAILAAMEACIERGLHTEGRLPGGLNVARRAPSLSLSIHARRSANSADPLIAMDFVNLWAIAVNEENAAGGPVVTAPTNGAAGIIPAVLRFYERFHAGNQQGKRTFLLAATAIGSLYKRNASISGAEVGCQGEVGVACSMAAAGLAAALGASNAQVENAAEIGMEHNLGLTCDPIGGLVQIPCIERNAMGAMKAIDAARLSLLGDGTHTVSLDKVIATMLRTGRDMHHIYKETSLGGLAVNLVEC